METITPRIGNSTRYGYVSLENFFLRFRHPDISIRHYHGGHQLRSIIHIIYRENSHYHLPIDQIHSITENDTVWTIMCNNRWAVTIFKNVPHVSISIL